MENFLKAIESHHIQQEEFSKRKGENFNVFRLCGVNHYENLHSDIIADFLNPEGSHDCGNDFLLSFFRKIGLDGSQYQNAKVKREYSLENDCGRVDILIQSGNNKLIIENKIYASEGIKQLQKYREWLDHDQISDSDARQLLFLTLNGRESAYFNSTDAYKRISYKEHILPWLAECIRFAAEKPFVRESLIQYKNLVEDLTKGGTMEIDQKLFDIISANFKTAITVRNYVDEVKAAWLWDNIVEELRKKGFSTIPEDRDGMILTKDIFLIYKDEAKKKKIVYAFDSYGFKNPRREIYDENDKEKPKSTSRKSDLPHNWNDDFFAEIIPANAEHTVKKVIENIIKDKDDVLCNH